MPVVFCVRICSLFALLLPFCRLLACLLALHACRTFLSLSLSGALTCHNIQYVETVLPGCNMLISNVCEGAGHQVTLLYLRLVVFLCRHQDSKHVAVHINLQDKGACSSF